MTDNFSGRTYGKIIQLYNRLPSVPDDMMENDCESLRERVGVLEKKVFDQNDEIVCLRSTLADVLRRLDQMEHLRSLSSSPTKELVSRVRSVHIAEAGETTNGSSSGSRTQVKRQMSSPSVGQHAAGYRSAHYQSTGSLLSDTNSSNSASPAPSPSPTQLQQQQQESQQHGSAHGSPSNTNAGRRRGTVPNGISPANSLMPLQQQQQNNGVPLQTAKRWSSTSDFAPNSALAARRLGSSSLLNLNVKSPAGNSIKHGTRDASFNAEDGFVKFYLRGRPIIVYAPTPLLDAYSLSKVNLAPQARLKMDWVYGYRGRDCRSNLYFLPTGEMIYFIAAVVVLHNTEEQQQRHYLGHTDDIKCLVVHPNKLLIASGQTAGHDRKEGKPHVRIWNSVSLHTLHVIGLGEFEKSINCLAFSKADGGSLLVVVDDAPDHNLSLWDWQKNDKGIKIGETKCSSDLVVAVEFHPMERYWFVTCGKSHVCFWSLENGSISRKLGLFETREKPKYVTCLAFADNGDVLTGDSSGNILVWSKGSNTVQKSLRSAHEGPVFSLLALKDGRIVSGGGKDGQLLLWDPSYRRTGYIAEIPEQFGNVRTLSQGKGSQILVGTTRNCIVAGNFDLPFTPLVIGHTEELSTVCVHPNQNQFLSGGHDKLIMLWDTMSRTVIWSKDIGHEVQSICFSPDGFVVIIGTITGKWLAMDAETREIYASNTDGNEPLQVVKFSPNGQYLAVGSRDNNIYIYQTIDDYRKFNRVGRCVGHSSYVTHMDWANDSIHLQTNSGDYELLYWNAGVCRQLTQPSTLRDVEWSTLSCTLNFSTFGIWPDGADGTDVNACCRSHSQQLIVTGDDFGRVKLFNCPASQPKSLNHSYVGHSSHVTDVCFLHDDTRVISSGGRDSSIIQWAVQ